VVDDRPGPELRETRAAADDVNQAEPARPPEPAESAPLVPAPGRSRAWAWAIRALVAAAVLAIAGVATGFVLAPGGVAGTPVAVWGGGTWLPPGVHEETLRTACGKAGGHDTVIVYFTGDNPDDTMRRAADTLGSDSVVASVKTETQQEAYVRFKEIFAEHPDLVDVARPEALPASVILLPRGVSVDVLHTDLDARDIEGVDSFQRGCDKQQ
jgi:hypothetical protein